MKFKHKGDDGYWNTPIRGRDKDEAVAKAKEFVSNDKTIVEAILVKTVYSERKIEQIK